MKNMLVLPLLFALAGDDPEAAKAQRERLYKVHLGDALEFTIYRDADRHQPLEFRKQPIYVWSNPVRGASHQDGLVFLWTSRGRAEAVGTIFSSTSGPLLRAFTHEFHSLSMGTLYVDRRGTHDASWTPRGPGIEPVPIDGAPAPVGTAAQRLGQMRALAREFSATTRDASDNRYTLRLLSQPLFRYESTDPEVLDGALFAFVTSAGTDPEALLVIEARKPKGGAAPVWHRALARFTDLDLSVQYKGHEVFSAPLMRGDALRMYPKQQYRIYADRLVTDPAAPESQGTKP
jgi:hypothetical protein